MKTLFIDCGMGAAGDMLVAALLELIPNPEKIIDEINALGIPNVSVAAKSTEKCGIMGTQFVVTIDGVEEFDHLGDNTHDHDYPYEHDHDHDHSHHHNRLKDIEEIVNQLPISNKIKTDVREIYGLIAEAESHVHGVPVSQIHFHEVGDMDAIADIVSVCILMDKIAPDQIIASPIHVGSGQVKCAHGILPVPAPATAFILQDVPIYGGSIQSELCTPTGAAILKYFVTSFDDMPVMTTSEIGYGMGKKDFSVANCVRVLLGETKSTTSTITELVCNIDDMTAEALAFAMDRLFEAGALEVYSSPVSMKKNRTGTILCVMCKNENKENIVREIFKHTTTLGIREYSGKRYTLDRHTETITTSLGDIRKKVSSGYGVIREKLEYDDLAKVALENDLSIESVMNTIEKENNS